MSQGTRRPRSDMGPQDGDGQLESTSTPELEGGRIHPEVISAMMALIEKLRGDGGRMGTSSGWFDELWGSKSKSGSQEGSQLEEGAEMTKIARSRRREGVRESLKRARDTANAFLEIGNHAISQIKRLEGQLEVEEIADRTCLLSLPDEILAIILEGTAWRAWADEEEDLPRTNSYIQTSIRLSHICQRLRRIAVSTQSLWDRTINFMPAEVVESCFNRLSAPIAEVAVSGWSGSDKVGRRTLPPPSFLKESYESYLTTICPFSQHWRRYIHEDLCVTVEVLKEVASLTRGLYAPHLSEMAIHYNPAAMRIPSEELPQEYRDALYYFSTWSIPSLSSLAISNLIPLPHSFSNSHFLTKLCMGLTFVAKFNPGELASFLGSLSQLDELLIRFELLDSNIEIAGHPNTTEVVLSGVRKMELEFYRCTGEHVDAAFIPLRFPSVAFLKLCAWGLEEWQEGENIDDVVRAVLCPDAQSFPKLSKFELGIGVTVHGLPDMIVEHLDRPLCTFRIPFASLRHIRHLALVGMVCVFVDNPDMSSLPSLRSLTLKNCGMLKREWALQLLPNLFERGLQPSLVRSAT
ncbi:hypothetical protein SCHPADRAFT_996870 [Schizopora paradoxa]|uniref:Uncharacterized protein n=1 Tax=Schizopora paradoxa TaxID=27342 RepID=A0A0H2RR39_9AGAM|nr:hypothetical protein SCHPADRAFT_996870 [Schizopora paradoxa]